MRAWRVTGIAALLAACADHPPPPDWQTNARGALDRAVAAYFAGDARAEAQETAVARTAVASTGRPALAARAELVMCAAHAASLVFERCAGYEAVAVDAEPAERAYAAYLAGRVDAGAAALLPAQHRPVAAARDATEGYAALASVEDPLARLVAAAVLLERGLADRSVVERAVDTASAQGWRRPLLAWLGAQLRLAEQAGDADGAARIRRRAALVAPIASTAAASSPS
jgi:hypothetical protein